VTISLTRPFADRRFGRLVWAVIGIIGWSGVVLLGGLLLAQQPPKAGFDLTLILDAGRRVAAGQSPYLAGAVGSGTQVENLFYSYPPPVAQAAVVIGGLSNGAVLALVGVLATAGFGAVAAALRRLRHGHALSAAQAAGIALRADHTGRGFGTGEALDVVLPTLALAPFVYPFAVALLFGNVDAWFPLAYGGVLLAVSGASRTWRIGGGIALGLVTVAKLHPAALLGWLAIRGFRPGTSVSGTPGGMLRPGRRTLPAEWATLGAALGTILVVVGASLVVGGIGPWQDYVGVLRAGTAVNLVTFLNIGPASQLALLAGDPGVAASVTPVVTIAALAVTAGAAWAVRRTDLSLATAAASSLVVSPITWFHYPVALLPFAVAAWVAARGTPAAPRTAGLLIAALVVAALAIAAPVAVWIAVALALVAIVRAQTFGTGRESSGS
jgi:hypothetical protein